LQIARARNIVKVKQNVYDVFLLLNAWFIGFHRSQQKDSGPIGRIQNLNGTILDKMIFMSAREDMGKCGLGKLAPAETGRRPFLATAEPCEMVGNKDKMRSAVGQRQCSWLRMMVARRVGIETRGDPGGPERLAQSSRSRGELVSLGSAGGGWSAFPRELAS
jgi:hypothetical protein